MEVKAGYKQTEVGVIPEEWAVEFLKNIGHIKTGPFGTLLKAHEYSRGDGKPLISVSEVGEGALRVDEHTPRVPPWVIRRLPEYVLNCGDIVFGRKGAVDRSALVRENQAGWFLGSDGIRVRLSESCDPAFVIWHFQRSEIKSWLLRNASGSTMPSMNQEILKRISLPLPPLTEQRVIAAALGDADALLGGLKKLIAKKRDLKQAAMQQLLTGQQRLPGFNGEWVMKFIKDIAPLQRGFDLPTPQIKQGRYPVVYSNGVLNRHSSFMVKGPGVVTGRSGTIGNVHFVEEEFWPHNTSLWVTSFKGNDPKFIFYLFQTIRFERFATGSGVPTLNRNDVHGWQVRFPRSLDEQTAIAAVLSDMDAELAALEARLAKTRLLKQGMMQELLTGRIRLV